MELDPGIYMRCIWFFFSKSDVTSLESMRRCSSIMDSLNSESSRHKLACCELWMFLWKKILNSEVAFCCTVVARIENVNIINDGNGRVINGLDQTKMALYCNLFLGFPRSEELTQRAELSETSYKSDLR